MSENKTSIPEIEEVNNTFTTFIRFFRDIVIIFLLAFFMRSFIMTPFQIQGDSMNDNYFNKEYILVNRFSYLDFDSYFDNFQNSHSGTILGGLASIASRIPISIWDPHRGDVVVLKPHVDQVREFYIKRIIGLPGETIKIEGGKVFIKTINSEEFIQIHESYLSLANIGQTDIWPEFSGQEFTIPNGMYWVMGDNRINSSDSRNCFKSCSISGSTHFLKRSDIIGKVALSFGYFNIFENNNFPKLGSLSWQVKPRFFATPGSATYPELEQ